MDFLKKLFSRTRSAPPGPAPFWGDAFGALGGPEAPAQRWRVASEDLPKLDLGLRQRGLEAQSHPKGRWSSDLRVAYLKELPDKDWLLVLAGHRVEELSEGLRFEARVPMRAAEEDATVLEPEGVENPQVIWHMGLPKNWRDRCDGEERQRVEAHASLESKLPERRCSGASALARLELLDRAPWVERAVVFWEESEGRADLPLMTLFMRELDWLQAAEDPIVDSLLALMHLLAQENASLQALVHELPQPRSAFGHSREQLLETVPTEVAAAAAGLAPAGRKGYAGPGRYEAALRQVQDTTTRAALRVEAAQVMLERYEGGWSPTALHDVSDLLRDTLYFYADGRNPVGRAGALVLMARTQTAMGDKDSARKSLEEAAECVIDERGLPRDPDLAQEILKRLG
ncbi:MAG: hypothetical protein H6740_25580 [Alphaproteobacteria bacterium]|nr:hypothetical protein [Alphaproteobacteria bacterium]